MNFVHRVHDKYAKMKHRRRRVDHFSESIITLATTSMAFPFGIILLFDPPTWIMACCLTWMFIFFAYPTTCLLERICGWILNYASRGRVKIYNGITRYMSPNNVGVVGRHGEELPTKAATYYTVVLFPFIGLFLISLFIYFTGLLLFWICAIVALIYGFLWTLRKGFDLYYGKK